MRIGTLEVGGDAPVAIIPDLSNAHNGSLIRAHKLIDAAKDAGCSAMKFQCYTPDELVALRGDGPAPSPWGEQGWSMRNLYEKAQTPHAWFPELVAHCDEIGLPWFSSVFGLESLALLESLNCPAYKIAALDNQSEPLATAVAATGKPVIASERNWQSAAIRPNVRLYCPEGYPQERFQFFDTWHEPRIFEGFSYHGTNPDVCVYAVAAGACIIEAHIQLDDEPSELEASVSLAASQFKYMVNKIRQVEELL